MKAGFISLGCSKNLVDTEVMLGILKQHGIELTANPAEADILIVNTCAFIQSAKEESITTILNMAEYKESGRCRSLIVAGCLGQRYKQELLDEIPEADAIIGTGAWPYDIQGLEVKDHELQGHSGPGTGGLTSLLFWEWYQFTHNRALLADCIYPALAGMSQYLSKVVEEHDGKLLVRVSEEPA